MVILVLSRQTGGLIPAPEQTPREPRCIVIPYAGKPLFEHVLEWLQWFSVPSFTHADSNSNMLHLPEWVLVTSHSHWRLVFKDRGQCHMFTMLPPYLGPSPDKMMYVSSLAALCRWCIPVGMLTEWNRERDVNVPGTECGPFQEELFCHRVMAHIISLLLDR